MLPAVQDGGHGILDVALQKQGEGAVVAGRGDGDAFERAHGTREVMGIQAQLADIEPAASLAS